MSEIVYPQGCRSVTEDLGPDELIRRLKVKTSFLIFIQFQIDPLMKNSYRR